jgi:hypothetical protein
MRRSPLSVLAGLVVAAVLLTGCTSGGSESSAADGGSGAAGGAGEGGAAGGGAAGGGAAPADGGAGGESGSGQAAPDDPTSVLSGRVAPGASLVRTADLTVRVDDVRRAADQAARVATAAGGVVESEERTRVGDDGSATAVLRVPPAAFGTTLTRLAELGEEVDRRLGTTDVTEQVVDLEARTASQRASVARVRALLDRAASIGEVVQVEAELTRRTADLESLEARLAALEGQVDLSTITLRLTGEDGALAAGGPQGFADGLAAGWSALVTLGRALGVTAGALLPFTPLLLAGVLLWRLRTRRPPRPASPAA